MVSYKILNIKEFLSSNHKLYGKNRDFLASFHGRLPVREQTVDSSAPSAE